MLDMSRRYANILTKVAKIKILEEAFMNIYLQHTGLFKMIVGILTTCHLVIQLHVISFYGVTSRIRFMFLVFPQVSRN